MVKSLTCGEKTNFRLGRMGLTEGVTVTLVRRAPPGDPIEIKVRDFFLAIRLTEADKIEVTPARYEKAGDKNV